MTTPKRTRSDFVLPTGVRSQLGEIASSATRGGSVRALFLGPAGTGKTLAARVLAGELNRELVRVDLSTVVTEYIGETEKNLAAVFARAEGQGVVLFFDEADALFGKRSEVEDAHDRYANVETSCLLRRMEEYEGLAILATHNKVELDAAALRCLRCRVEFPPPPTP